MTLDRSAFDKKKKKKDSVYIYIVRTTDKHSYKHRNTQNTQEEIRLSMKKIVETKKKKRLKKKKRKRKKAFAKKAFASRSGRIQKTE